MTTMCDREDCSFMAVDPTARRENPKAMLFSISSRLLTSASRDSINRNVAFMYMQMASALMHNGGVCEDFSAGRELVQRPTQNQACTGIGGPDFSLL
jgi:hypothetical protein